MGTAALDHGPAGNHVAPPLSSEIRAWAQHRDQHRPTLIASPDTYVHGTVIDKAHSRLVPTNISPDGSPGPRPEHETGPGSVVSPDGWTRTPKTGRHKPCERGIMDSVDANGVGYRLRRFRKLRGLTQEQLAGRTHFSTSLVKKIEQGSAPASAALVAAAAEALGTRPDHLYGIEPDITSDCDPQLRIVPELRAALDADDDPRPHDAILTLEAAGYRINSLARGIKTMRYDEVGAALPTLLHHLYVLADNSGQSSQQATALLHDAYRLAATIAARFRQPDLAAIASERHRQLAPRTGDPLRIAVSAYHRSTHHLQQGSYAAGMRILERAQQYVDRSPAGRAVAIQLCLRAAVIAARGADSHVADGYIKQARAISREHNPQRLRTIISTPTR